ncbi:MAG: tRNA (N(6)-L-threonylcarbamoyladenosine(37)-C(2))-methylthiotransferase [Promethearchaeota archaeon]|nr:MAG: tRNA (N(6)-L-threonylcarbamoyladenosine(37)-C(2))-methylthiotransferase [Candidatus Lokiarchaeota archaeon]
MENSFYIETYGCTMNKADSRIMFTLLKESNYVETSIENAEFIIVNTCGVKQQTENKIKQRLKELHLKHAKSNDRYVIIAGCLPHISKNYIDVIKNIIPSFAAIIDLDNIDEIVDVIEKIKKGERNLILFSRELIDKSRFLIDLPLGKMTGYLTISEGCEGNCTYCCVKNARKSLYTYNPETIINNAKHQLNQGAKQLFLTSQDCSTYQHGNFNLADLIQSINDLPYEFFLRMGMVNPKFLINEMDQLNAIFSLEKVYKLLHVPVQSGSNKVLQMMNRDYDIRVIKNKLQSIKDKFPTLSISTDIICGFPGESEEDFGETMDFIRWLRPDILNISKFTARPGTKAKLMKQVDSREIKERSIRLSRLFRDSLRDINKHWENWQGKILLLHEGDKQYQAFGRNFAYKNVFLDKFNGAYGNFVKVKVYKVDGFNLYAQLL